jgi:hypothetical protein
MRKFCQHSNQSTQTEAPFYWIKLIAFLTNSKRGLSARSPFRHVSSAALSGPRGRVVTFSVLAQALSIQCTLEDPSRQRSKKLWGQIDWELGESEI